MITLTIKGMMCKHCQARVEKVLKAVEGVTSVVVDLEGGKATIEGTAAAETLSKAVTDAGYEVTAVA